MFCAFWKSEFQLALFGIVYSKPSRFARCQWQSNPEVSKLYLVYRWLFTGYFIGSLIACICEPETTANYKQKWPIYLTNWGYSMYTLQAVCAAFIVTNKFYSERKKGYQPPAEGKEVIAMPRLYQVYWILHSVSVVLAVGITISYWGAVYNPNLHSVTPSNLMAHAFNAVFMILDMFLVSHPFRLLHFYWPVTFVGIYLVFSAIYYACGGLDRHFQPYIYPMLKWEKGVKTVAVGVVGLLFVFGVHCLVWLLFLLRRCVYDRCVKKEKGDLSNNGFASSVAYSESCVRFDVI